MKRASLALGLVLAASLAYGRAGGGGSYSGGGGGSSGGGFSGGGFSGGSGGFSGGGSYSSSDSRAAEALINLYIQAMKRHPIPGTLITVFIIYFLMKAQYYTRGSFVGEDRMMETISKASEFQDTARMQAAVGALRSRDPAFEPSVFLNRAGAAFLAIQDAWSKQDMAPARAFVSDGIMERFSIQIDMQKADRLRNAMDQVQVLGAELVEIESDKHFDTLHVRLTASAIDTDVSIEDGRVLRGSGNPEEFTEIWSFLRRPGAKTLKAQGLIEGFCPSCGAPLAIADAALCSTCKSWVNSGEYDWVLCEITQEPEWAVRGSGDSVPGFTLMAEDDPALNTQFLEDRASVAFWRWQLAISQKSAAPLNCTATETLCAAVEAETADKDFYYRQVGVGAVEVWAFEPGEDFDRAHVQVKWSGDWHEGGRFKGNVLRQHVLILSRKSGVKTDPRSGLRSSRCASCGAPPASREDSKCAYCGAAFNDGARQWVVSEIVPVGLWRRPEIAASAAPAFDLDWTEDLSYGETLQVMVCAMMADGQLAPKEREYLEAYASKKKIQKETIDVLIQAAREGHLSIPKPATPQEAEACLKGLIRMSLADGVVEEHEMNLMTSYAASIGLQNGQLQAMIKEERLALYKKAKPALRDRA